MEFQTTSTGPETKTITRSEMEVKTDNPQYRDGGHRSSFPVIPSWLDIEKTTDRDWAVYKEGFSNAFVGPSEFLIYEMLKSRGLKLLLAVEVTYIVSSVEKPVELMEVLEASFYEKTRSHLDTPAAAAIERAYVKYTGKKYCEWRQHQHPSSRPPAVGLVYLVKIAEVNDHAYFAVVFGSISDPREMTVGMFNVPMTPYVRLLKDNEL